MLSSADSLLSVNHGSKGITLAPSDDSNAHLVKLLRENTINDYSQPAMPLDKNQIFNA